MKNDTLFKRPLHYLNRAVWQVCGVVLALLVSSGVHATVFLSAGTSYELSNYSASTDTVSAGSNTIHARASVTSNGAGGATAGAGGNSNCIVGVGCASTAAVQANGEFDGGPVVFRAVTDGGTISAYNIDGGSGFQLTDLITPIGGGTLVFNLHLDWGIVTGSTGSGNAYGQFGFKIETDNPNCQVADGCVSTLFEFIAFGGSGTSNEYSYAHFGSGGGSDMGFGSPMLDISFAFTSADPFILMISGGLLGNCGVDFDAGVGSCYFDVEAYNSAYVGITGNFTSQNGYGYTGFARTTNNVPAPGTLLLLSTGLLGLGRFMKKSRH